VALATALACPYLPVRRDGRLVRCVSEIAPAGAHRIVSPPRARRPA